MSAFSLSSLPLFATLAAFGFGFFGLHLLSGIRRNLRASLTWQEKESFLEDSHHPLVRFLVQLLIRFSQEVKRGRAAFGVGRDTSRGASKGKRARLEEHIQKAGLESVVSLAGCERARVRFAFVGALAGLLLGVLISIELALLLALVCAVGGLILPGWVLKHLAQRRVQELERSLPEMLEVVALGLRSGLSFDRSFQLYSENFPNSFARACASTHRSWTLGLRTREEALRDLSLSYGSDQLERTVSRIVRALRFGSALAPDLEAAALEARAVRRAKVEEQVAKAPVKMMVPTGTLILPAMLLLVLGPILLELMQGG